MKNKTFKPCPLCGSENISIDKVVNNSHIYIVSCENCEATAIFASSREEAIEKWNRWCKE